MCLAALLAEWTGLEPATPCVTGMYSNQLNYHSVWDCKYTHLFFLRKPFFKKVDFVWKIALKLHKRAF